MPLILTDSIIKSADVMKAGWTLLKLIGVKEEIQKGKTVTILDFEGLEGPSNSDDNVGRTISHFIYHAAINGDRPVPAVVSDLIRMVGSFEEVPYEEAKNLLRNTELQFGKMVNKNVWGEITDETYEGKLMKKIKSWSPNSVFPF